MEAASSLDTMPEVRGVMQESTTSESPGGAVQPERTASPTPMEPSQDQPRPSETRTPQYKTTTPISSHVFLINGFEQILESKSTRRFTDLRSDTLRALGIPECFPCNQSRRSCQNGGLQQGESVSHTYYCCLKVYQIKSGFKIHTLAFEA